LASSRRWCWPTPRPGGLAAQLRDLNPEPGYVGALAVLGPGPVVVEERSGERLLTPGDRQRSPASARSTSSSRSMTATMPPPPRRTAYRLTADSAPG
jgi:hypothetical protein